MSAGAPGEQILGRNEALAELGLRPTEKNCDWLASHWQGELKWDASKRKNRKAWSKDLIERLKSDPDRPKK